MGTLAIQLIGVAGVGLLLAVLQASAGVGFQHPVFRAVMPIAEAAVSDNSLSCFLAFLEVATGLARSHVERVVASSEADKEVTSKGR